MKFTLIADPLLEDDYPIKSLYQAIAVAAMCLQEEADTRPLISDVVTALDFLAKKKLEVDEEQHTKETSSAQNGDGSGDSESDDDDDDDDDDEDEDDDNDDNSSDSDGDDDHDHDKRE